VDELMTGNQPTKPREGCLTTHRQPLRRRVRARRALGAACGCWRGPRRRAPAARAAACADTCEFDVRTTSAKGLSLHAPTRVRARQQRTSDPKCELPGKMQGGCEWPEWAMSSSEVCVPRAAGVAEDGLRGRPAPPLGRLCTGAWLMSESQSS